VGQKADEITSVGEEDTYADDTTAGLAKVNLDGTVDTVG
jgi:hypothetical protein